MTTNLTAKIWNSKKNYFDNLTEKSYDPKLNQKAYWSILKSFTNRKKLQLCLYAHTSSVPFSVKKTNHPNNFLQISPL